MLISSPAMALDLSVAKTDVEEAALVCQDDKRMDQIGELVAKAQAGKAFDPLLITPATLTRLRMDVIIGLKGNYRVLDEACKPIPMVNGAPAEKVDVHWGWVVNRLQTIDTLGEKGSAYRFLKTHFQSEAIPFDTLGSLLYRAPFREDSVQSIAKGIGAEALPVLRGYYDRAKGEKPPANWRYGNHKAQSFYLTLLQVHHAFGGEILNPPSEKYRLDLRTVRLSSANPLKIDGDSKALAEDRLTMILTSAGVNVK
jgi:hypothetical protein